jgi:O-antigen/teichoic acid export membrane protein
MILLRWAIRLTGLVSTIMLARLLMPSDFGIVAMAMFVVGLLELLSQSGQKLTIIRHAAPTREDYDTAWTVSVIVGLFIAAAIVALSPLAQIYFHEPRVVPVMCWLALRSILGGFENIGAVDFRRDLQFNRFFIYNVCPKLVSFMVTILLAFLWRNYWALVAGMVCQQLAMNVLSYTMHPYRPRFSIVKINEIRSFSVWTLVRTIGNYLNSQIDLLAVGGILGTSAMGRYTVAADVAASPSRELVDPLIAVLYPVMSKARFDPVTLRGLFVRTFGWSAVICFSASVGVMMVAHDLIHLVLGAKWFDIEPLMGWLALEAGLLGLCGSAYTAFDAIGKPHLGARMQWVRVVILVLVLAPIALLLKNIIAIAIVRLIVTVIFIPTLFVATGREMDITPKDYLAAMWRPAAAASVMALVIYWSNVLISPGLFRLLFDVLLGVATFSLVSMSLWKITGSPVGPEQDILTAVVDRIGLVTGRRNVPESS